MKKLLWIAGLAITSLLAQSPEEEAATDVNVNAKYTVESVKVAFVKGLTRTPRLSNSLRTEIDQVVGGKLDNSRLQDLAKRIKKELRVPDVAVKIDKGDAAEHVRVSFEVKREPEKGFDMDLAKFVYHSRQSFSADGSATVRIHGNSFIFGLVSDNDSLTERFAGFRAGYERKRLGTDRLQLRFTFSSFHQQWNNATLAAALPSEIYRTRQSFNPEATLVLAEPLEWSFGADFSRFRPDIPQTLSARTESSNAVVSTLRYHQRWGAEKDQQSQDVRASYGVRAARPWLESDYSFVRHAVDAGYKYRQGHSLVDVRFNGGWIDGITPLYERLVLGNARTLRGWNKYDLDPTGGSHAAHGTIEYSYHGFMVFYDTGAVWDRPEQKEQKNSLGVGFKSKEGFQLAVAFPVRNGRADPIFYVSF